MSEELPATFFLATSIQAALEECRGPIAESLNSLSAAEREVEVTTNVAPAAAVSALSVLPSTGDPGVCLRPLGVGVVPASAKGNVRLAMVFESGVTLPFELTREAAALLAKALIESL
ncbi:MAG: hypothetical protein M3O01_04355 [Pseudomonadota bacterium]|nr:hypothetical protein [Pseudomonadota bacterium]